MWSSAHNNEKETRTLKVDPKPVLYKKKKGGVSFASDYNMKK